MKKNSKNLIIYILILFTLSIFLGIKLLYAQEVYKKDLNAEEPTEESINQGKLNNNYPLKDTIPAEQREKMEQLEKPSEKSKWEKMQAIVQRLKNTQIDFWGKVVDQDGKPLEGVTADMTIDGDIENKRYVVLSDKNGLFQLLGKKGSKVRVEVSRNGYAQTSDDKIETDVSKRDIYYVIEANPPYSPPSIENPQIFMLRKKNPIANLAYFKKEEVIQDISGQSQKFSLKNATRSIDVIIRCWSSCPVPFTYDKYDWRAEIEILNGKLKTITELEPITAPKTGYQKVFRVEMPKNTEINWIRSSPNGMRDFWIQFDDGTYAKARIEILTGRTNEVDIEVWYNLDGTNNFEQ